MRKLVIPVLLLLSLCLVTSLLAQTPLETEHGVGLGAQLPLWSVVPFVGILLSIALFPLLAGEFWHHHFGKVSAFWAIVFAVPFLFAYHGEAVHEILHILIIDYIPFIILLWSLFTVAGGILIEGSLAGTPVVNTIMLFIGTAMASWVGTTGAAMIMIRPVLRANASRKSKVHIVVFFIFLVANIGGSLTPLGDPPLFLGFLHHVPFFWTLNLIKPMGFVVILLLGLFFLFDTVLHRRETASARSVKGAETAAVKQMEPVAANPGPAKEPLRIRGGLNFLFLAGVMGGVLMSGLVHIGEITVLGVHTKIENMLRELTLISMGLLSLKFTAQATREANGFNWFPIKEVAYLFAGIFMTIIPALAILKAGSEGHFDFLIEAVKTPAHYFWVTGGLSSFLDNAPTYLTFLNTALGSFFAGSGLNESQMVAKLIADKHIYLLAISSGAVFMGANTYIGNAPNFMVKSIAEQQGVPMPSFFGYMLYSMFILVPLFILTTWIFY
ncbi:MAG: sodium:proton antiporter [bacterium]